MNTSQESDNLDSMMNKNSTSEISFESHDTDGSDVQNTLTLNNDDSGISNNISLSPLNNEDSGICNVISISPRNSLGFEDIENQKVTTADKAVGTDLSVPDLSASLNIAIQKNSPKTSMDEIQGANNSPEVEASASTSSPKLSQEFDRFLSTYKHELDQLKAQHKEHYQDLKERFNERVDDLLKKLSEANSRYVPLFFLLFFCYKIITCVQNHRAVSFIFEFESCNHPLTAGSFAT